MEEKIIMYDSPEAGRLVTVEAWEVDNPNGKLWTKNEHSARWNNCTHMKCECGGVREKSYTICPECRLKKARERYLELPFKEWDGVSPVCTSNGDEYFFDEESLIIYIEELEDQQTTEVSLLYCDPIYYNPINYDRVAEDTHDEWEPPQALIDEVNKFNEFIKTLKPHSWRPGKIRTSYTYKPNPDDLSLPEEEGDEAYPKHDH